MGGIKFSTIEQVQKEVLNWRKELTREFEEGIKKFVPQLTTCIERMVIMWKNSQQVYQQYPVIFFQIHFF